MGSADRMPGPLMSSLAGPSRFTATPDETAL